MFRGDIFDARFGREPFWSINSGKNPARIVARQSVVPNLFVHPAPGPPWHG